MTWPSTRIGDRAALEAALSRSQRAALFKLCRDMDIPRERWHLVPTLYRAFAAAAVWGLVRRLEAAGATRESAMITADVKLGVPASTARSWAESWRNPRGADLRE